MNAKAETHDLELQWLIGQWEKAGRNKTRFLHALQNADRAARPTSKVAPLRLILTDLVGTLNGPLEQLDPDLKWLVTQWLKAKGHRPRFIHALLKAGRDATPFTEYMVHWSSAAPADAPGDAFSIKGNDAERYFLQFMLHPEHWRLSGPCPRCGQYFLRPTRHVTRFCSRNSCGKAASVGRHREKQHEQKLAAVNEHIAAWQRSKSKEDWKEYVAQRAGVTTKLLTRWVNEGIIAVPTQQGGKHKA